MLPDILEVAKRHSLSFNPRTFGKKQTTCKCPFCMEDSLPHKRRKFYLSINTQEMLFRCWFCGECGGVFRFMALLEGKPESEILEAFRKSRHGRYTPHPAERLTARQLRLIGVEKPNWTEARSIDPVTYRKLRGYVSRLWSDFAASQLHSAYRHFHLGVLTGNLEEQKVRIKRMEAELGEPLLERVMEIHSRTERPGWCRSCESLVQEVLESRLVTAEEGIHLENGKGMNEA